ncbi:hypothetical protein HHI36_016764 [Cryptolaemus montrouzieri]|uniref:Uncharacterized protein n=1 Tax=Cryptolaemus montrouzieri TaxID=559131 RepID=A0ABD2NLQ9_9CUCU
MSAELRRSKRVPDKKNKNLSNVSSSSTKESPRSINKMDAAVVEDNSSTRKTAKSSSNQASRVRRAELETAISKKRLEQELQTERVHFQERHDQLQKQQELMNLKLALKLVEFQGEDNSISDKSSEI